MPVWFGSNLLVVFGDVVYVAVAQNIWFSLVDYWLPF